MIITITGKEYLLLRRNARTAAHIPVLLWWISEGYMRDVYVANGVIQMLYQANVQVEGAPVVDDNKNSLTIALAEGVTPNQFRTAVGLSITPESTRATSQAWTKEWKPFDGSKYYEKNMVDIRLKNGDIVSMCWPNAGFMNPCYNADNPKGYKDIPYKDVAEVRLTHHPKWQH